MPVYATVESTAATQLNPPPCLPRNAAHRTKRPWQGAVEPPQLDNRPEYDVNCYLCPGNTRAGGKLTEKYDGTYIFENDFAALLPDRVSPSPPSSSNSAISSLFRTEPARGKCFVICFSPRHNLTVAEMRDVEIERVVEAWIKLYEDVSRENEWIRYIQIFENKGAMMGCSNPHPHGQREYAHQHERVEGVPTLQVLLSLVSHSPSLSFPSALFPKVVSRHGTMADSTFAYSTNSLPSLLLTYAATEIATYRDDPNGKDSRVVHLGEHFVALVPYWAGWPFEVVVIPFRSVAAVFFLRTLRLPGIPEDEMLDGEVGIVLTCPGNSRHIPSLAYLKPEEKSDLARMLGAVGRRYDNLFESSFAYSMGVYQAPVHRPSADLAGPESEDAAAYAQLHVGFYPPLLRSSTVRKYLVGFELFAETQRDITPEQAAQRLRDQRVDEHYKAWVGKDVGK
ncbi:SPOSA6832_04603 [Sporobolomyces salmonicolor]|uniref:Galactose-1-phosphate uridylyltransferase n=1 Tax=Sporidiobolus salmonicolor TaxID=5005 RepID=A0A0D6ESG7_SPOSA|nr:SPOSA6832_04603 [Sporobolomyces salmonicolor]